MRKRRPRSLREQLEPYRSGIESGDLDNAIAFWRSWPMFFAHWEAGLREQFPNLGDEILDVYYGACRVLASAADDRGMDASTIRKSEFVAERTAGAGNAYQGDGAYSELWPDCLGDLEGSLPPSARDALFEAADVVRQLATSDSAVEELAPGLPRQVLNELPELVSALLEYLARNGCRAKFESLAEPVWRDINVDVTPDMVGRARKLANKVLKPHDYRIRTSRRVARLERIEPIKDRKD